MKLNETGLLKRSPRKITKFQLKNGGQKTNLQLTRVKSNGVSKTTTRKKQASKIFSGILEYLPFYRNTCLFQRKKWERKTFLALRLEPPSHRTA